MFTISKEFHFSAAHRLLNLAEDHPCYRLHGHNYIVTIELKSEQVSDNGFVVDFRDLAPLKDYIDGTFDHQYLNDIFGGLATTSEHLAKHFYDWSKQKWSEVSAVRVSETAKTWAEYRP
ncbi:MAG: 6-carboxytetrahydropterin synthase QueD [Hyphomicrobiales bacterium]|nr:MAG: 6-carboxytetrahydropterin synthase QueD [Hyphomicrobiales bacterium]